MNMDKIFFMIVVSVVIGYMLYINYQLTLDFVNR